MKFKNKRQKEIYNALSELGGNASCREIALKANMNVNGVSQTLGCMEIVRVIDSISRNGGDWIYQIK